MKRAAILARVSTSDQAEHGLSLQTQIEACQRWAQEHGYTVMAVLSEDISGSIPISQRPIQSAVYTLMENGEIDTIIVFAVDRLDRGTDGVPIGYMLFLADCQEHNVSIYSVEDNCKCDGSWLDLIRSKVSADERKKILERTSRGRQAHFRAGRVALGGQVAIGFCKTGIGRESDYELDPQGAALVRQVFDWVVNDFVPIQEVKNRLEIGSIRPRRGDKWFCSHVRAILKNESYTGWFSRKASPPGMSKKQIAAAEKAQGYPFPKMRVFRQDLQIIDQSLFKAAGDCLRRNAERAKRNGQTQYLLSGFIYCGSCGQRLRGLFRRLKSQGDMKKRFYKNTGDYDHKFPCKVCGREFDAEKIESLTWDYLYGLMTSPEKLIQTALDAEARRQETLAPKRKELESIKAQSATLEKQINNYLSAVGMAEDSLIIDVLMVRAKESREMQAACQRRAQELEAEIDGYQSLFDFPNVPVIIDRSNGLTVKLDILHAPNDDLTNAKLLIMLDVLYKTAKQLETMDHEGRRRFFERISLRVYAMSDEQKQRSIKITCNLAPDVLMSIENSTCSNAVYNRSIITHSTTFVLD